MTVMRPATRTTRARPTHPAPFVDSLVLPITLRSLMSRLLPALPALPALLLLAACARGDARTSGDAGRPRAITARGPVGPGLPEPAEDGQWMMPAKDYASTRYSGLAQITADNVKDLRVAWTFSTGSTRGHEAAPIVVDSMMYVTTPFPNVLFALDVTSGTIKWKYEPQPEMAAPGVACCDWVNRGAAYYDGKIYYNLLDATTVAVDAHTGKQLWRTRLGDIDRGESMTMAPLVVKGKVLVGNSGGEFGVRGWLTALDAGTGKIDWRAYSTGPDKDVLIGPEFKAFYPSDTGKDMGVKTWPGDAWKTGGGTVWGWISYDPELDLIYYGTGNPGPWNHEQRPGDNKWTAGIFARDPDDGHARWAYQWSPHDEFDWDGINEQILLDLPINGARRKVLVRAERDGFVYVVDRTTGEVLSADPFGYVTATQYIDLTTGRPRHNDALRPKLGEETKGICPAAPGMKDWEPTSYSPRTGIVYIPHQNMCMDVITGEARFLSGTPYVGMVVKMYGGPGGNRGVLTAWDPVARRKAWEIPERFPVWSGTVVTAGDVVFYGTMDGWFKAVHARTGQPLWQHKVDSGIIGQPVTYRAPDGKQYVAVLSGVGGWSGAVVSADLDTADGTAALGFVNAMKDLPQYTTKGGTLYVFALP